MSTDIERKAYRAHGAPLIRREGLLEPESLKRQQPGSDDRVCSKLEAFAGCDVVGQGWDWYCIGKFDNDGGDLGFIDRVNFSVYMSASLLPQSRCFFSPRLHFIPHPLPLSLQVKLLLPPQNGTGHSQPSRSTNPRVHPRHSSPRRLGRNAPRQTLLNRQKGYRAGARAVQRL
jgi:hypothetical protein